MRLQMIAEQDTMDFDSGAYVPSGTVAVVDNANDFLKHVKEGFQTYFENGRPAYWWATGNGSQLFISENPSNTPGERGIPLATFFSTSTPRSLDPVTRWTAAVLPPYTAAPIADNVTPQIGPVAWTTVALADALRAGPATMTNGVTLVTETTVEGITQRLENGFQVIRPNGQPAYTQTFLGGYLVDGNPLNVLLGGPWLPEQWAKIVPAIQAGQVPSPSILPPDQEPVAIDSGMASFAVPLTAAAAIGLLWNWFRKRKGN